MLSSSKSQSSDQTTVNARYSSDFKGVRVTCAELTEGPDLQMRCTYHSDSPLDDRLGKLGRSLCIQSAPIQCLENRQNLGPFLSHSSIQPTQSYLPNLGYHQ